jgi:hypothetical protein
MSTPSTSRMPAITPVGWAAIAAAVVFAICMIWMAGESHYKSCVAGVNSKFPAVAVSAFNGRTTGPLKVSFTVERQKAVGDCGRF